MADFLDTNVLVYAFDRADARKRAVALALLEDVERPFAVSAQVLQEFYWVATRKLEPALDAEPAHRAARRIARAADAVVAVDAALVDDAITLARSRRLPLWDAAIVCAARRAACHVLLTEDLNAGEEILGVTVRNPFEGAA